MEFKVLDRFINANEIEWSEATTIAYKADIRLFLEDMMNKKNIDDETLLLQSITNDDFEDWKDKTKGQYALSTLNRKITALMLFFKYVTVNKKITKENPLEGVKTIKPSKKRVSPWSLRKQKDILTHEELLKVIQCSYKSEAYNRKFDFCSARDRFLLSFEATTGVRISEALNITLDMLEEVENGYMVNITKTKTMQTKRVPIANKCLIFFNEYMEQRNTLENVEDKNILILSFRGKKMTSNKCNQNLTKLIEKAGIKDKHITNHSNRHMCRTAMTANGVQENLIKIVGGWTLEGMADFYLKDSKELDRAKIKACNII